MGKKSRQSKNSQEPPKYENIRARLEDVVSQLERGEGTLVESLAAYEEGVALVKAAHGMLDAAEKRLEVLKPRADGTFRTEDASDLVREGAAPEAKPEEDE